MAERARLEVTSSARRSRYHVRVPVVGGRPGARQVHEPARVVPPAGPRAAAGRARRRWGPIRGRYTSCVVPDHVFDELEWLGRRQAFHVVPRADTWRGAGSRGGSAAWRINYAVARMLDHPRHVGPAARRSRRRRPWATTKRFPITCATIPKIRSLPPPRCIGRKRDAGSPSGRLCSCCCSRCPGCSARSALWRESRRTSSPVFL